MFGFAGLSSPQDAEHLTAMVGDSIIFNCHIEFPESHPVPYVIQWEKKVLHETTVVISSLPCTVSYFKRKASPFGPKHPLTK